MAVVNYTVANGEVIAEKRNGVRSLYSPDPLGSTVALFDATQTKTDTWTYWPYGEVKTRTGTTATPFQFVGTRGYRQDAASRTYVRNRVLDTAKGRWMTQDPIGFWSMDWNLYRYVQDRLTTLTDSTGHQATNICGGGLFFPFCGIAGEIFCIGFCLPDISIRCGYCIGGPNNGRMGCICVHVGRSGSSGGAS